MEDKDLKQFSWNAFFLVTGLCCFLFSKVMSFLDGTQLPMFSGAGIALMIAGAFRTFVTYKKPSGSEIE